MIREAIKEAKQSKVKIEVNWEGWEENKKENEKQAKSYGVKTKSISTEEGNVELSGTESGVFKFLHNNGWNRSDIEDWYGIFNY